MASCRVDYWDVEPTASALTRAYDIAEPLERIRWVERFERALQRLPYFELRRLDRTCANTPMVEGEGGFSVSRRITDLVQIDLVTLWEEDVSLGVGPALHSFEPTEHGFNFWFAAVTPGGATINGVLKIVCTR